MFGRGDVKALITVNSLVYVVINKWNRHLYLLKFSHCNCTSGSKDLYVFTQHDTSCNCCCCRTDWIITIRIRDTLFTKYNKCTEMCLGEGSQRNNTLYKNLFPEFIMLVIISYTFNLPTWSSLSRGGAGDHLATTSLTNPELRLTEQLLTWDDFLKQQEIYFFSCNICDA